MTLGPDDIDVAMSSAVVNYLVDDHLTAAIPQPNSGEPPYVQPVVIIDGTHIELNLAVRLTLRIPPSQLVPLAASLMAVAAEIDPSMPS